MSSNISLQGRQEADKYRKDKTQSATGLKKSCSNLSNKINNVSYNFLLHHANDQTSTRRLIEYNKNISKCKSNGDITKAENLFQQLINENIRPNIYIFNSLLSVLVRAKIRDKFERIQKLSKKMEDFAVAPNVITYTCMIDACAKNGRLEEAIAYFNEMRTEKMQKKGIEPDVITYTCMIDACAKNGRLEEAITYFNEMRTEKMQKKGIEPDVITYTCMIDACAKNGRLEEAITYFNEMRTEKMQKKGIEPDVITYTCMIDVCAKNGRLEEAIAYFNEMRTEKMQKKGIEPNVITYTCMIDACAKNGRLEEAIAYFNEMRTEKMQKKGIEPNVITYTCMIDACAKNGRLEEAIAYFNEMRTEKMQKKGIEPNVITYTCMIDACAKNGRLEEAITYFNEMRTEKMQKKGIEPNVITYNCMIDACAKNGRLEEAIAYFNEMRTEKMQKKGIEPNVITYTCMIDACAKNGRLEEAIAYFNEMRTEKMQKKGIEPDVITYNCIMEVLAKSKQPQEALKLLEFLRTSLLKPDRITYNHFFDALVPHKQYLQIGMGFMRDVQALYKTTQIASDESCVDCHDASHGAACFLIALELDNLRNHLTVITGNSTHSKTENIGLMKETVSDFIEKHYPLWSIQHTVNPGRIVLVRCPASQGVAAEMPNANDVSAHKPLPIKQPEKLKLLVDDGVYPKDPISPLAKECVKATTPLQQLIDLHEHLKCLHNAALADTEAVSRFLESIHNLAKQAKASHSFAFKAAVFNTVEEMLFTTTLNITTALSKDLIVLAEQLLSLESLTNKEKCNAITYREKGELLLKYLCNSVQEKDQQLKLLRLLYIHGIMKFASHQNIVHDQDLQEQLATYTRKLLKFKEFEADNNLVSTIEQLTESITKDKIANFVEASLLALCSLNTPLLIELLGMPRIVNMLTPLGRSSIIDKCLNCCVKKNEHNGILLKVWEIIKACDVNALPPSEASKVLCQLVHFFTVYTAVLRDMCSESIVTEACIRIQLILRKYEDKAAAVDYLSSMESIMEHLKTSWAKKQLQQLKKRNKSLQAAKK